MLRRTAALSLTVLSLGLAACGDEEEDTASTSSDAPAAEQTTPAEPETTTTETSGSSEASSGEGAVLPISKDTDKKPKIPRPKGDAPTALVKEDIVEGKGVAAKAGDTVRVQYVGVSFSNGQEFDASWDRGEPFEFPLGAGQVIPGWDQGVEGMKVGGRRELVIPPDLGYGAQGSPPAIAPNETLVFVIDLLAIN